MIDKILCILIPLFFSKSDLSNEIERKYLVNISIDDFLYLVDYRTSVSIHQWYLIDRENVELRLRRANRKDNITYILSAKFGNGICRKEFERSISRFSFKILSWILALLGRDKPLIKERSTINFEKDYDCVLDSILNIGKPLQILEIEFDRYYQAINYNPSKPQYIIKDVTNNTEYESKNIWRRGVMKNG